MTLVGDVYNALDQKVGKGPLWSLTGATISRALDGAGSVTISAPGTEERAIDLLQNERRIKLYGLQPGPVEDMETLRHLGTGILRNIKARTNPSGWTLDADGPDSLDLLKRKSTLLARIYSGLSVAQIAADLAALAGWTTVIDAAYTSKMLQCRFDGVSVLRALQNLAQGQGLHLREGAADRTVEIGAFGQSSGLRLVNAAYAPVEIAANDNIMLIETLNVSRISEQIVNWLVPIGGGEGESAITLQHCTRVGPYAVQQITVNGKTHYYIADAVSIAAYGQIEQVGTFKDINAISNSDADLEAAANALYDAAVAWLQRNKDRIDSYTATVHKVRSTVRPGDKVHLSYKGFIENEQGLIINYANVDSDFWVMKATERITLEGLSMDLELTNIDQVAQDVAMIVIGAIESIQMQQLSVKPYPTTSPFVYRREIDATHTAIVPIEISNGVLYLNQCRLYIKSRSFRVTAKAAATGDVTTSAGGALATSSAAGGDHRHKVASQVRIDDSTAWSGSQAVIYNFAQDSSGTSPANLGLLIRGAGALADMYTEGASGAHTHSISIPSHTHTVPSLVIDFGIEDDNQFPDTVSIKVDDIDVTAALGGPWGAGGSAVDTTIDITSYLVNAAGGLRQRHEVTFSCTGGQGEIEVTVELRTTVQSIAVS